MTSIDRHALQFFAMIYQEIAGQISTEYQMKVIDVYVVPLPIAPKT